MSERSREMDRRIITELQRDARQSNVALGRTVGLSEGAVRRRIDILVSTGELRFSVEAEPELLGMNSQALIRIRCAPHLIDEVIETLSTMPELQRVFHCTGQFDLTAVAHFPSTQALREFTTTRLGAIAGVVEMQSEIIMNVIEPARNLRGSSADTAAEPLGDSA
ncbi:Lrp/AsnC family transcriptional regulator [Bogoriella caseilytica]|uniref:AsnC family transcriptional regulator n=1 Tax=Bogoriella caseilytica TaxID=56055 RepID=A0A3N2BDH2_9MICO|nr:Lrp/AsnC family transcriptional regulator [Bogoriella caseilytica]ROR73297.1 AsnC family transcriptional regulator [Bogoriella caseilytica]